MIHGGFVFINLDKYDVENQIRGFIKTIYTPSPNLDLNNISDKDTIESMRDLVSYLDGDLDENI